MSTLIFIQRNEHHAPFFIQDRIFLGEGLFETIAVSAGNPRYPKFHWERMTSAALSIQIPFNVSWDNWLKNIFDCIEVNQIKTGGVKAILSGGCASRGLIEKSTQSHLVLNSFAYVLESSPLKLVTAPWQRDRNNPIYHVKAINYLESILATRHAQLRGADDVIFFNMEGHATDTAVANLFVIQNDELFTPSLLNGVFAGITRQRLLSLCQKYNIGCTEKEITHMDLLHADALFICNTLQGIRPVASFEATSFNIAHPLMNQLQELLTKDLHEHSNFPLNVLGKNKNDTACR